jgi:hypothetical protein
MKALLRSTAARRGDVVSAEFNVRFQIAVRSAAGAQTGKATQQEYLQPLPTPPGVLLGYGVLWVLLGFGVLYVLSTMDEERGEYWSPLSVLQYGAWTIGGCFILIAGLRWSWNYRRRSCAHDG